MTPPVSYDPKEVARRLRAILDGADDVLERLRDEHLVADQLGDEPGEVAEEVVLEVAGEPERLADPVHVHFVACPINVHIHVGEDICLDPEREAQA